MDAKDSRAEATLTKRSSDGAAKFAIQYDRSKCHDAGASAFKGDATGARPCAVIGPDRVVPPARDAPKKPPAEPWLAPDPAYRRLSDYPHKMSDHKDPTRNISPRQTFQENMQRIIMPPGYNTIKMHEDPSYTSKNKLNVPLEVKYCEVPYNINPISSDQKHIRNTDHSASNVNPLLMRGVPPGWPAGSVNVRPLRPYGAPDVLQYPDYPNCPGPRPLLTRTHASGQDELQQLYADPYYHENSVRFKPYPNIKERYPQARYEYIGNYPNPYHPPHSYAHKYEVPKTMPPHTYSGYPPVPVKYTERVSEPALDGYQRAFAQQGNYAVPIRNPVIHPPYRPVAGSQMQNKLHPYPPDGHLHKSPVPNKLPYDPSSKMYIDYETRSKPLPMTDNYYLNELPRPYHAKNIVLPNYGPASMHGVNAHPYYIKEMPMKNYEYAHFKNMDPSMINHSLTKLPPQFSPSTLAISPADSSASNETAQTHGTSQEDCGYVSQSSVASVRSIESLNRIPMDVYGRYDYRYGPVIQTSPSSKPDPNSSQDPKSKKDIRQFISSWSEGDEENTEGNAKRDGVKIIPDGKHNFSKQYESANNQEQLYVLGLVNVPSEELSKYEHIQKVSKLPENIKGYNSLELLNQFEEAIESSNITNRKPHTPRTIQMPLKSIQHKQDSIPRAVSPLDVEAKISQSVIHKDVGCNFEIKPCSPKMLNVEVATPMQTLLNERVIEKVANPHNIKSPIVLQSMDSSNPIQTTASSCKMINGQHLSETVAIDHLKPNYSLQDLESNSGVCLASLPRLDTDIELNFPEVNQQFINANKTDSVITASFTKELPALDADQTKSLKNTEYDMNYQFSPKTETETDFSKLSKYRKFKRSVPECNNTTLAKAQASRVDSVIIKNPDNIRSQEENNDASGGYYRNDLQEFAMNLVSQVKTSKVNDQNEADKLFNTSINETSKYDEININSPSVFLIQKSHNDKALNEVEEAKHVVLEQSQVLSMNNKELSIRYLETGALDIPMNLSPKAKYSSTGIGEEIKNNTNHLDANTDVKPRFDAENTCLNKNSEENQKCNNVANSDETDNTVIATQYKNLNVATNHNIGEKPIIKNNLDTFSSSDFNKDQTVIEVDQQVHNVSHIEKHDLAHENQDILSKMDQKPYAGDSHISKLKSKKHRNDKKHRKRDTEKKSTTFINKKGKNKLKNQNPTMSLNSEISDSIKHSIDEEKLSITGNFQSMGHEKTESSVRSECAAAELHTDIDVSKNFKNDCSDHIADDMLLPCLPREEEGYELIVKGQREVTESNLFMNVDSAVTADHKQEEILSATSDLHFDDPFMSSDIPTGDASGNSLNMEIDNIVLKDTRISRVRGITSATNDIHLDNPFVSDDSTKSSSPDSILSFAKFKSEDKSSHENNACTNSEDKDITSSTVSRGHDLKCKENAIHLNTECNRKELCDPIILHKEDREHIDEYDRLCMINTSIHIETKDLHASVYTVQNEKEAEDNQTSDEYDRVPFNNEDNKAIQTHCTEDNSLKVCLQYNLKVLSEVKISPHPQLNKELFSPRFQNLLYFTENYNVKSTLLKPEIISNDLVIQDQRICRTHKVGIETVDAVQYTNKTIGDSHIISHSSNAVPKDKLSEIVTEESRDEHLAAKRVEDVHNNLINANVNVRKGGNKIDAEEKEKTVLDIQLINQQNLYSVGTEIFDDKDEEGDTNSKNNIDHDTISRSVVSEPLNVGEGASIGTFTKSVEDIVKSSGEDVVPEGNANSENNNDNELAAISVFSESFHTGEAITDTFTKSVEDEVVKSLEEDVVPKEDTKHQNNDNFKLITTSNVDDIETNTCETNFILIDETTSVTPGPDIEYDPSNFDYDQKVKSFARNLRPRYSLKRSLSDSALNALGDNAEDTEKRCFMLPKRKKVTDISNIDPESHLLNIIQGSRRNSISTLCNENFSFCILIDDNCIVAEENYEQGSEFIEYDDNVSPNPVLENAVEDDEKCPSPVYAPAVLNENDSNSYITKCDEDKSWVEDVGCEETIETEDIAENIVIGEPTSPKDTDISDYESDDENIGVLNNDDVDHTSKVKHIYGDNMCTNDAQLVDALYRTPQMDVNRRLMDRESQVNDRNTKYYDSDSLEMMLSEPVSNIPHVPTDSDIDFNSSMVQETQLPKEYKDAMCTEVLPYLLTNIDVPNNENIETIKDLPEAFVEGKAQDNKIHSSESSLDNVFSFVHKDSSYTSSSSPEVSSTTSEEKSSSILLKISNCKSSRTSEVKQYTQNENSCKFTEKEYMNPNYKNGSSTNRPLLTKGAQKYIPPLKETIPDLKVKLALPKQSLLKFQKNKVAKEEPKLSARSSSYSNTNNFKPRQEIPKKLKPKFEDVLKNIDEVQFQKHKEKNKKTKKYIPKVVIKKNENGSHYASTSSKDTFNPDLTGRKWQPWVFIEKNQFIDKMALRNKTRAVFSHRRKSFVLAEKICRYKSISSSAKFIISQPKIDDFSAGNLKYTIKLKHTY